MLKRTQPGEGASTHVWALNVFQATQVKPGVERAGPVLKEGPRVTQVWKWVARTRHMPAGGEEEQGLAEVLGVLTGCIFQGASLGKTQTSSTLGTDQRFSQSQPGALTEPQLRTLEPP